MRLPFVCKPVYNVPVKPVKSKDDCKPVCNVPSKPVRSQDVCKPVYNVPYNSGNSNVCRPFSDDASNMLNPRFYMNLLVRSLLNTQNLLSVNLLIIILNLVILFALWNFLTLHLATL